MKKLVIGLAAVLLLFSNCKPAQQPQITMKDIVGVEWLHSHEDDKDGMRAYRPADYNFPPSRGRQGFKIEEDGTFTVYGIAPTDGRKIEKGSWTKKEGSALRLDVAAKNMNGRQESFTLEFVQYKDQVLYVKQEQQ